MSDDEEKKSSIMLIIGIASVAFLILLIASILLMPLVFAVFPEIILFVPDSGGPQFDCKPMQEYDESYNRYVNETWVESNRIEGYEDIPEEQKRSLSKNARRYLRDSARVDYTPTHYPDLSKEEKEIFMKAIESDGPINIETYPDKEVVLPEYVNLWGNDVRYNNTTYECVDLREEGA